MSGESRAPAPPQSRRTQADRRAETRKALLKAARQLFLELGYEETSTPHLVRSAGLTRGALYHHFKDKKALFAAIIEQEADEVGQAIAKATENISDPSKSLLVGTEAYFDAMTAPGRAQLLLLNAPSVLGHEAAEMATKGDGLAELREGLLAARPSLKRGELDALANILSAAFDRAALAIAKGADRDHYVWAMQQLLRM